jgi:epidermal growth factor receptor substrate 15
VISIFRSESKASSDQLPENTQSLYELKNDIADKDSYRAEGQALKVVASQSKIDNLETFSKPKNTWKNSLGQEYPEGVSQETITQNDDKGLLISIITKRIVVINGHGDEYQRVQTVHTITYSKNGKPTTEYLWQTETQGPHLTKHY